MFCRCKVIPLKYGSFVSVAVQISARHNLFPTDLFFYMKSVVYIMANTLKMLTSWLSNVHLNITVEYMVECRGLIVNSETCYFCFDPAFVWPSLGHADFHSASLACKPFPGHCACTRTGR